MLLFLCGVGLCLLLIVSRFLLIDMLKLVVVMLGVNVMILIVLLVVLMLSVGNVLGCIVWMLDGCLLSRFVICCCMWVNLLNRLWLKWILFMLVFLNRECGRCDGVMFVVGVMGGFIGLIWGWCVVIGIV